MNVMEKKFKVVSKEELTTVSGGLVIQGHDGNFYDVSEDHNGSFFGYPFPDAESAQEFAKMWNESTDIITHEEFYERFGWEFPI